MQARVNEELVVLLKQQPDMCCLNSMVYVLVSLLTLITTLLAALTLK